MWQAGVLGSETSRTLLCTNKLRKFKISVFLALAQTQISPVKLEEDCWKYSENGSRNFQGGVGDLRRENKIVRQYPCSEQGTCTYNATVDLYMSRLLKEAHEKDVFYLTPLSRRKVAYRGFCVYLLAGICSMHWSKIHVHVCALKPVLVRNQQLTKSNRCYTPVLCRSP